MVVCCAASGGRAGRGGPTGWPRSSTPGTERITSQFAQFAKHYGIEVGSVPPGGLSAKVSLSPRSNTSPARGGARRRSQTARDGPHVGAA